MRVIEVSVYVAFIRVPHRVVAMVKIPSPDIIDVPVSVVINAVSRDLIRINPDVRLKVRMECIATCVNDRSEHLVRTCVYRPGFRGIDVSVINRISWHDGIYILAAFIMQCPHLVEFGVIGEDRGISRHLHFIVDVILFGIKNSRRYA